jgi:hypothetical protein
MKKISTVAAKQSKNFREQKLTIGLDLGDRSSWYCVLDEAGDVLLEQKLGTTPKAMKEVFGGMPRSRIALETGMHSPWVSRLLSELGHEVIVAHARNVRLIAESRRKDDRFDARTLARLARIDPQLLSPVRHRGPAFSWKAIARFDRSSMSAIEILHLLRRDGGGGPALTPRLTQECPISRAQIRETGPLCLTPIADTNRFRDL